ncbi:MAG: hypothetical protein ABJA82_01390 [Myxococcales bacterium]
MSKRLQVVVDDLELSEIQRAARQSHMTSSEWVRQVLRKARRSEPTGDLKKKLAIVRRAAAHAFPTADIEQMIEEIERGQLET